jgi:hypothetical protein
MTVATARKYLPEHGCENGFGQPVAIVFLARETKYVLETFSLFRQHSGDRLDCQIILVDKDFTQLSVLRKTFPHSGIFLCAFHVLETMKSAIAKERIPIDEKQNLLQLFWKTLYSDNREQYDINRSKFIDACPADNLAPFYAHNWDKTPELWCLAFRRYLRSFGNRTTNQIKRFFLQ